MTNELKQRMDAIELEMNEGDFSHYDEWSRLNELEQEEYRSRELPEITKYFETYIKGKTWEELDRERWNWYSDWHKDVFGFRPRQTRELGVMY